MHNSVQGSRRIDADRITELASEMESRLDAAIARINDLNCETKIISLNAKMEAARAGGTAGAAFSVVARSMQEMSAQTARVAEHLAENSRAACTELREVNRELSTRVRGERLSDLALMNIDVVDRNLYERSCDCRWWATDKSVVDALIHPTEESLAYCSHRLGQILDSYTVYFDIVVADLNGRIIANGRPSQYSSVGMKKGHTTWFSSAMATRSGAEFAFESVHRADLVQSQRVLAYSCTVREEGNVDGRVLGVLCVLFRWDALGQTIVQKTPLSDAERAVTRACLIDDKGLILADTEERFLECLHMPNLSDVLMLPKNFQVVVDGNDTFVVGHARAPGFETYTTGWHSLVIQKVTQA